MNGTEIHPGDVIWFAPGKEDTNGYLHTGGLDGVKHFALWPLAQAAESCFGTDQSRRAGIFPCHKRGSNLT